MYKFVFNLRSFVVFFLFITASHADELTIIRERMKNDIFQMLPNSTQAEKTDELVRWKSLQKPDGTFSDFNYTDNTKLDWGPLFNLERALTWSIAYFSEKSPLHLDADLKERIFRAIQIWDRANYVHVNWWYNEIGMPFRSYRLMLLWQDDLPAITKNTLIKITANGHLTDHPSGRIPTGQNLLWYSEMTTALGVLKNDSKLVAMAVNAISNVINYSVFANTDDGLANDNTFHQHKGTFYSGGYGQNFSYDLSRFFNFVGGTSLAFSAEKYKIISDYMLDGQLWLVRGRNFDYSAMGRWYARAGIGASLFGKACEYFSIIPGARQTEFKDCAEHVQSGSQFNLSGNRTFWMSDIMTHHRPEFMISVKAFSSRVLNGDTSPSGEGLKTHFLSDGLTYIYKTGEEYRDIFPIWDFLKAPGITEEQLAQYPKVPNNDYWPSFGSTSFVGGVSDGTNGTFVMDFVRGKLSAHKAWFFTDFGMIALGSNINCSQCLPVTTSINQEWSKGEILYGTDSQSATSHLDNGQIQVEKPAWVLANGIGYLSLSPQKLTLKNELQTGSWNSIAAQLSTNPVTGKVTSLWLNHASSLVNDSYAYVVNPNATEEWLRKQMTQPDFKILENSLERQVVESEGLLQAVFFKPGKLVFNSGKSFLQINRAAVVQIQKTRVGIKVSVASPDHQVGAVTVNWNWLDSSSTTTLNLPSGNLAGQSAVVSL